MHFRVPLTALVLLLWLAHAQAVLTVSATPDDSSVSGPSAPLLPQKPKSLVDPASSASSASSVSSSVAANDAAIKAAKIFSRESWLVSLPKGARETCMAGVCLGDPIDGLPSKSANADGARVRGDWQQVTGGGIIELDADPEVLRNRQLQVFEDMRDAVFVCSLAELAQPLTPKMRLVFVPDDGSPGGIEVSAQLLPKKRDTTKSAYAVSAIEMSVRHGSGEEASAWPASIASIWPGLKPVSLAVTAQQPERIAIWSLSERSPKGGLNAQATTAVSYSVLPLLSASDAEYNALQWAGSLVTHKLQWLHGLYGVYSASAASPSEALAVDAALRKQKGCEGTKKVLD